MGSFYFGELLFGELLDRGAFGLGSFWRGLLGGELFFGELMSIHLFLLMKYSAIQIFLNISLKSFPNFIKTQRNKLKLTLWYKK